MTSRVAKLLLGLCTIAAVVTFATRTAGADCDGACGIGCGACNYNVFPGNPTCNADGTETIPIQDGYSCWTSPCCQFHDTCIGNAGCLSCNPAAAACNLQALSFYGSAGDGCAGCAGPGFPGCDPHGSWGWFDERNYSRMLQPGEDGNHCPPPQPCHPGDGCPPISAPCVGAMDNCHNACACGVTPPCVGSCSSPLCGQDNGCGVGVPCSNADDNCGAGCGYINLCGHYCGDCPPSCDHTCYSCGTSNGCGEYCGDCYSYWCDWNWEGLCCYDTLGNYWCEYYYP